MLVFDLRGLAVAAVSVHDVLAADDPVWAPSDRAPADGVQVDGRLSSAGPGRFYFSGSISGTSRDDCRRCLRDVATPVSERVQLLFGELGEDTADDPDVFEYDPRAHELDIRAAVREQWLLIAPRFAQCRDDCAGLCPTCGADLNAGPCGCAETVDDRWAALRQAAGGQEGSGTSSQ
jgi:uncharacterized protein